VGGWSAIEVGSAVVFGGWFLLSLAAQILPRSSAIRQSRIGWVIPEWRFFAPTPAVEDRVVVYRCRSGDDEPGPLHEVELPESGPLRALWNPGSRRHKALFDLADGTLRLAGRLERPENRTDFTDPLVLSEPYLALLSLVSTRVDAAGTTLVQFGVIARDRQEGEDLVFVSRWHAVAA
jgi:hypothetical protein